MNVYSLFLICILSLALSACTSQGSGILGQQGLSETTEDGKIKYAPFGYDMLPDTISYNSCVMLPNVRDSRLPGIKIGASEGNPGPLGTENFKSGVKVNTEFLKHVGAHFVPDYPSTTITGAQIARILNADYSIQNHNAFIQFAVRRKSDYAIIPDLIVTTLTTPATPERDAAVFSQVLSDGYLGSAITKGIQYNTAGLPIIEGPRLTNLSSTSDAIPIEGSLYFNASADESANPAAFPTEPYGYAEAYTRRVRNDFNSNIQLLTSTFGGNQSTTGNTADDVSNNTLNNIKRPFLSGTASYDTTKAFGRGYHLRFESQNSGVASWNIDNSRLVSVSEVPLDGGLGIQWSSCEQFVIADQKHWDNNRGNNTAWFMDSTEVEPNCAPLTTNDTTIIPGDSTVVQTQKNTRVKQIKRIRRHYSASDWNIGLMFVARPKGQPAPERITLNLCVSPRTTTSCYLPTTGILQTNGVNIVTNEVYDVGIQYDRTRPCYLTIEDSNNRDAARKKGRCAQFASICVRTASN